MASFSTVLHYKGAVGAVGSGMCFSHEMLSCFTKEPLPFSLAVNQKVQ